jgi:hypothetical protein
MSKPINMELDSRSLRVERSGIFLIRNALMCWGVVTAPGIAPEI